MTSDIVDHINVADCCTHTFSTHAFTHATHYSSLALYYYTFTRRLCLTSYRNIFNKRLEYGLILIDMTYFELTMFFIDMTLSLLSASYNNKRPVLTVAFNSLNVMNSFNVNVNYFDFFYPAICWVNVVTF